MKDNPMKIAPYDQKKKMVCQQIGDDPCLSIIKTGSYLFMNRRCDGK